MFIIGLQPGRVFSEAEALQGKCPALGTVAKTVGNANPAAIAVLGTVNDTREFILVKVGAAQNLINGTVVQITGAFVTSLPGSAGAGTPANIGPLAVIVASVTASTSQLVFAQIYGMANVLFDAGATASATPGQGVKLGATSGNIAGAATTASNYIGGMTFMATVSGGTLAPIFLNYPKVLAA